MSFHSFTVLIISIFLSLKFSAFSALTDNIGPSQSINEGTSLVSKQGTFELGFFRPGNSANQYLGIRYKNIRVQTIIWVVNRCNPINDSSGLLTIHSTGDLVLLYRNSTAVWSPSLSKRARNSTLQLLDSGNLVLRDENNDYLWQSFDYPSDTQLPGMKLGWDLKRGLNRKLTAWNNWDDPCPGDLVYGFDIVLFKCPVFDNIPKIVNHGYLAPEYAFSGQFSTKSDVFSFGIMLLEIVSGKKSMGFQHENDGLTLMGHAWTLLQEGRQSELIDTQLRDSNHNLQEVFCCIKVGLLCVQQRPIDRPNMSSVILMLSSDESLLPEPKPPGYFVVIETQQGHHEYPSSEPEYSSRNSFTITSIHGR